MELESHPFLYVMDRGILQQIELYDGLTFGTPSLSHHFDLELVDVLDRKVSGVFRRHGQKWLIQNMRSTLIINGSLLEKNQECFLLDGAEIRISGEGRDAGHPTVFFIFMENEDPNVHWKQVNLEDAGFLTTSNAPDLKEGDCKWINGSLYIRINNKVIYQETGSKSSDNLRPSYLTGDHEIDVTQSLSNSAKTLDIFIHRVDVGSIFHRKTILREVHLTMQSGQMVMLLGGSGAGKSTFMEAVTGLRSSQTAVKYGGLELLEHESMKKKFAMVPQDSQFRMDDTVFHTLDDAAALYGPDQIATDKKARKFLVHETLKMMDIERVSRSKCSSLSGGQKKKLGIALEYISQPEIMFLDEPDSGVDGPMVDEVIHSLRKIADEGKILCMITHSPDRIRDWFDRVAVIARGTEGCGRLAFYGKVADALQFFSCNSLEEVVGKVSDRPGYTAGPCVDEYIRRFERMREESGNV